jgi:hypothetical protein
MTIEDGGDVTLEVLGPLAGSNNIGGNKSEEWRIPRIVGRISDDGCVTLEDCVFRQKKISSSGVVNATLEPRLIIIGALYEPNEEILLDRFRFSLEGLEEWLRWEPAKIFRRPELSMIELRHTIPSEISFALKSGAILKFGSIDSITPGRSSTFIKSKAYIEIIRQDPEEIEEFIRLCRRIRAFFSLATDRSVNIFDVVAHSRFATSGVGEEKYEIPLKVFYKSTLDVRNNERLHWRQMLFSIGAIRDSVPDIINAWLAAYDTVAPAIHLYFGSVEGGHKYVQARFLALAQAIETYHRRTAEGTRWPEPDFQSLVSEILSDAKPQHRNLLEEKLRYANELPLRARVKSLLAAFPSQFGTKKERSAFCDIIVSTRNYLTHYDKRSEAHVPQGAQLWAICMKMEILLKLHLLKYISFSDAQIDDIVNQSFAMRQHLERELR